MTMLTEADIFSSVFGLSAAIHTTPTPLSTPLLGDVGYGQSFGSLATPAKQPLQNTAAQLQVKKNLSWSTATRFLSLDNLKFEAIAQAQKHSVRPKRHSREVEEALDLLLSSYHEGEEGDKQWDLVSSSNDAIRIDQILNLQIEWYTLEVRNHFQNAISPHLVEPWSQVGVYAFTWEYSDNMQAIHNTTHRTQDLLRETCSMLLRIKEQYISQLENDILPRLGAGFAHIDDASELNEQRLRKRAAFEKKLHSSFLHALPAHRLASAMSLAMYNSVASLLNVGGGDVSQDQGDLFELLARFQNIGLGDDFGQRAFANAMWRVLEVFIGGEHMKVDWDRPQSKIKVLTRFLTHGFVPLVEKCVVLLGGTPDDVCHYQKMTVARLGRQRIRSLFDYVVRWDQSIGAIRDIKEYIFTPEARLSLTTTFSDQLQRRLLHAGATTTHILNLYINIIHAFNELDGKGVLLDRIAKPIRQYLRQRDDTARIIVSSLLAEVDQNGRPTSEAAGTDISIEIAKEMAKPIVGLDADEDHNLDFDDMEWTPDPIDASPDFKRSKSPDVTSALLSLYNREDFINELKTILGEHLLRNYDVHEHFEKEERLLELFKNRLGEDRLQACEVMLRDVQSSHQMNKTIHRFPPYANTYNKLGHIDMNAHILSSFFWPSLKDDDFKVPEPVQALRRHYEEAFESVKDTRKLRWLTALGRVAVELELEDRTVEEDVPTWTASVIYAFESATGEAPIKSVEQLEEELEMDEALVRNAVAFWRSKQVLRETGTDTYTVIENLSTLSKDDQQPTAPVPMEEEPAVSAVKSQRDLLNENAELYKTFILGMLTNQGNLPLMRIFMMLKVVVPGGFGFGLEEVKSLLQDLVADGKIAGQGEVYGVRRG
jgi:anaphase-promoting complex subunit 2